MAPSLQSQIHRGNVYIVPHFNSLSLSFPPSIARSRSLRSFCKKQSENQTSLTNIPPIPNSFSEVRFKKATWKTSGTASWCQPGQNGIVLEEERAIRHCLSAHSSWPPPASSPSVILCSSTDTRPGWPHCFAKERGGDGGGCVFRLGVYGVGGRW